MEKKNTIILLSILTLLVIAIGITIVLNGAISIDSNLVMIEVNPKVEFVVDKDNIVTSYSAVNPEAKILLVQENYIGKKIDEAVPHFLGLCAKANYIDVDSKDNAVKVTILDGLTQALDVRVVESIHKYLKSHEILCSVIENINDLNTHKEAKKHRVDNINKYRIMKHIVEDNYSNYTIDELNQKTEKELIDIIAMQHTSTPIYTEYELNEKVKMIDFNREKYDTHMSKITNNTQRAFADTYSKHQKEKAKDYKINYDSKYNEWHTTKI